jgi:hypothetical protein
MSAGSVAQHLRPSLRLALAALSATLVVVACSSDQDETGIITVPGAQAITTVSGSGQAATVGGSFSTPLVVHVTDSTGNPLAGAFVTFAPSNSNVELNGDEQIRTDASGNAQISATIGTRSGVDTVTASVPGASTNAVFVLTANPDVANTVVPVEGNQLTGPAGTALSSPLVVQLLDVYGNPEVGVPVTFFTTKGTLGATSAVTDNAGEAQTTFTFPGAAGSDTVLVTAAGKSTTFVEIAN